MRSFLSSRLFAVIALCLAVFSALAVSPTCGAAVFIVGNAVGLALNPPSQVLGVRLALKVPDPSGNMVTNGKVVFDNPRGVAYHEIQYRFRDGGVDMTVAQIKARVESIVQKFNGKAVREWTPTTLDTCNSVNGAQYAAVNGYLSDYLSEPWRRTIEGEERNALGTGGLGQFTTEIKFTAAAVAPSVEAIALVDDQNRPFNAYPFRHVRSYPGQPVINGAQQWPGAGPERRVGLWYDRIHFFSSLVTAVRIEMDKSVKWEDVARADAAVKYANRGFAMQANVYTVGFSLLSGQFTDQLPSFKQEDGKLVPVENFLLKWTGTGAGTADVVTEQYEIAK